MKKETNLKVGDLLHNEETQVSFILVEYYKNAGPPCYFWKMLSLKSGTLVHIQAAELNKEILKQNASWVVIKS